MPSTVSVTEGIKYGFGLLMYVIGVGIAGGVVAMIGLFIAQGEGAVAMFIGGLMALIGVLVIYAGMLGITYKVIADGVNVGVEAANA